MPIIIYDVAKLSATNETKVYGPESLVVAISFGIISSGLSVLELYLCPKTKHSWKRKQHANTAGREGGGM